ncbi:MAG: methyltransferase domain-containing protein [Burkholderiales bacterium]|nr:methyltransferase domain-containing protein [Burkholderiales bacterium]
MKCSWRSAAVVMGMGMSMFLACAAAAQKQLHVPPEYERDGGPYVPTPNVVVDQMLAMANVGARDHVIDLGSGDGIIVITAAHRLKASGYGVDIDEELIRLSNQRAKSLGLDGRVLFEARDIFKTDVSKATVVTLYLLPEFMQRLRPKLFNELRPGTRIVSHDYHFEEWQHDADISFDVPEKEFISGVPRATLYLWIVPAKIDGAWRMQINGGGEYRLALQQRYQNFEGTAEGGGRESRLISPKINGTEIRFVMMRGADRGEFSGRVNGNRIEGTADFGDGKPRRWSASKGS